MKLKMQTRYAIVYTGRAWNPIIVPSLTAAKKMLDAQYIHAVYGDWQAGGDHMERMFVWASRFGAYQQDGVVATIQRIKI